MNATQPEPELNTHMTISEQINAQPGRDVLRMAVWAGGRPVNVTITRAQADELLAHRGYLFVDPITGVASVRPEGE